MPEIIREDGHVLSGKKRRRACIFKCGDCGAEYRARYDLVTAGRCLKCKECAYLSRPKKHGESKTKLYKVFTGMKQRCGNTKIRDYKWYGAKGISVEWNDFYSFREWALSGGYKNGLVIDRIDSFGNYSPSNCQWITQSNNAIKSASRDNFGVNANIKISNDVASEICEAFATGLFRIAHISKWLGVSTSAIRRIIYEQ